MDQYVINKLFVLLFFRYSPGDKFKMHYDGAYVRADGTRTFVTLQIYLNDASPTSGGETTFFSTKCLGNVIEQKDPKNRVAVLPKTGMVLVFEHKLLHEGSILKEGKKYTIRTDVLYE